MSNPLFSISWITIITPDHHLDKNQDLEPTRSVDTLSETTYVAMVRSPGTHSAMTNVPKDEQELEEYIVKNNKEFKKIKKGSKEYLVAIDSEKSKLNIQRFKGLGEMNPEELWSTTLDPENRNLLQVKYSKDLKKDQNLIHTLMGNDVALRKDFIVSNAINVQNLDI